MGVKARAPFPVSHGAQKGHLFSLPTSFPFSENSASPYFGAPLSCWPVREHVCNFQTKTRQRVSLLRGGELWDVRPKTYRWPRGRIECHTRVCTDASPGQPALGPPAPEDMPQCCLPPLAARPFLQLHSSAHIQILLFLLNSHFELLSLNLKDS